MATRGELFDPIFGAQRIGDTVSDQAWIAAMLDVEAALTRAAASIGLIDKEHCDAIVAVASQLASPGAIDLAELGDAAAAGGNPVIPLVGLLRARAKAAGVPASAVHPGATSQDILDTALILMVRRGASVVMDDLTAAADSAADLARAHRDTPMVARTLGQQALPTTFGLLAAGWFTALDAAAGRLQATVSTLPVQLGGAAGTLAALHPHGIDIQRVLADELGLATPDLPWHTDRVVIADAATALGIVAGAISKPATDLVMMASTELAEVAEQTPGGSSTMPHKQNPVAAITARACARRAPALVSTILANMDHEFARAAGAWHAEWETITGLLHCTGGAAQQLSVSLSGLRVDADAMARNLEATGGLILAERVTTALTAHVDDAREIVTRVATSGTRLDQDPTIAEYLTVTEVAELTDPTNYLGHAVDLVDRALAVRERGTLR